MFRKNNGNYDLVFTDVILPDKTGLQLIEELYDIKSDLNILLCSGHTEKDLQWNLIKEKKVGFLHKPYSIFDLVKTIKSAISNQQNKTEK